MNDNELHALLENAIHIGNLLEKIDSFSNDREEYIYSTARSLSLLWLMCKDDENYKVDFECALRNYLLLVKKSIVIKNYVPSSRLKEFGLQIDLNTGKMWTSMLLPDFSNVELVKQLYMQDIRERKIDNIHNLKTNPYVEGLTGFECFKSNEQKLAVTGALRVPYGYSCLVSMTTGGGKSLITQTIAYQESGLTIVIVPTVSLMMDQYKNAKDIINSDVENEIFYHHSGSSLQKFYKCLENKTAKILFISPESLIKNKELREKIEKANNEKYLKNLVVDEAHIIIEWGSLFRIDFQCLDTLRKNFLQSNNTLKTYLLSATYSDETIRQLKMFYTSDDKWIEIRCEKLRHETRFDIIHCDNYGEKNNKILEAIDLLPRPMIVYVKSPDEAEKLKERLNGRGYNNLNTFTGKTNNEQRLTLIEKWKDGQFDLMIATCAFGVGVDKKNVRTVLHTYVPENPNKYYQEAGRGGRDGLPCLSSMIYTNQDVDSAFNFVSKVITTQKLKGRWFSMLNSSKTQPLLNSKYMIDTYVKPDYNEDEEFIDSISNQDINWNVNVILFLRRNGLISIDDIQYINNKYVFYITVIERKILTDNNSTVLMIDEIRDKEWENTEREFSLMKSNLDKVGKSCWSDMFTKIYRKTHDYCAGCNEHIEITDFEDTKTLKIDIEVPLVEVMPEFDEKMYGARCMLIINSYYNNELEDFLSKGINVLVSTNEELDKLKGFQQVYDKSLLYCNFTDFIELVSVNRYFISGVIGICIPDHVSIQNRIVNIIENSIKKYDIRYLLFSEKDYEIRSKNKHLSELPIIQHCRQE
ncbi:Helicase conserved C-terminal domain-containing protein [Hathewaya proteolytica DSM 3090]|uniref:DNA 3'-5' helicase n=1 Tax=Hathewaya proteolytica DSM 3090 TaxID=1121331 RepID=A0A1M6LTC2_9CLOT|nr:DEAD/DEAH box helicase [Hathewaya proteolytica]SHJ74498.1 Helicase conserved C-terminal domain-containing protein [Hathewaya proteolytica DSM 3090]